MLAEPVEDLELHDLSAFEFTIPCTSMLCDLRGRGAHAAHWLVRFSCGHDSHWCHERWSEYCQRRQRPEHRIICRVCLHQGVVEFWIPLSRIRD